MSRQQNEQKTKTLPNNSTSPFFTKKREIHSCLKAKKNKKQKQKRGIKTKYKHKIDKFMIVEFKIRKIEYNRN